MTAPLEQLFERYVRRGDVRALGEVFDRAAPELLVVAAHLSRDAGAAEDLVQATFLGAIEGAARYDRRRSLLPWLVGILTHRAQQHGRREARALEPRELRERNAPDPARETEAGELAGILHGAVERLPATYRDVLRRHLFVGDQPREIAADLGRAPGTVRVQIHRGLELLRQALPAGLALGAGAVLPTRGLAAVRADVVAAGGRALAEGLVHRAPLAALGIAGWRAVSLAGLSVAALLATWAASSQLVGSGVAVGVAPPDPVPLASAAEAPEPARRERPRAPEREARAAAPRARAEALAKTRAPEPARRERATYMVAGVLDADGGRARVRRPAAITATAVGSGCEPLRATSDEHGRFELDVSAFYGEELRPEGLALHVDHPHYLPETVHLSGSSDLRRDARRDALVLDVLVHLREPAIRLLGRVRPSSARRPGERKPREAGPVRVAVMRQSDLGSDEVDPVDEAECGTRDDYALRLDGPGDYVVVAWSAALLPSTQLVRASGEEPDPVVPTIELEAGEALFGKVRLAGSRKLDLAGLAAPVRATDGEPVAEGPDTSPSPRGCEVLAVSELAAGAPGRFGDFAWVGDRFARRSARAGVDDAGNFWMSGLEAGAHFLVALAPDALPMGPASPLRVDTPAREAVELTPSTALVRFTVQAQGEPVRGAIVVDELELSTGDAASDSLGIVERSLRSTSRSTSGARPTCAPRPCGSSPREACGRSGCGCSAGCSREREPAWRRRSRAKPGATACPSTPSASCAWPSPPRTRRARCCPRSSASSSRRVARRGCPSSWSRAATSRCGSPTSIRSPPSSSRTSTAAPRTSVFPRSIGRAAPATCTRSSAAKSPGASSRTRAGSRASPRWRRASTRSGSGRPRSRTGRAASRSARARRPSSRCPWSARAELPRRRRAPFPGARTSRSRFATSRRPCPRTPRAGCRSPCRGRRRARP